MNIKNLIKDIESLKFQTDGSSTREATYNEALKASVFLIRKYKKEEQEKNPIPEFVVELVKWTIRNNAVPADMIENFKVKNDIVPIDEINLPEELDLEKLSSYFLKACNRYNFEKACFTEYLTV